MSVDNGKLICSATTGKLLCSPTTGKLLYGIGVNSCGYVWIYNDNDPAEMSVYVDSESVIRFNPNFTLLRVYYWTKTNLPPSPPWQSTFALKAYSHLIPPCGDGTAGITLWTKTVIGENGGWQSEDVAVILPDNHYILMECAKTGSVWEVARMKLLGVS